MWFLFNPRLNPTFPEPAKLPEKPKARFPGPAGLIHVKRNTFGKTISQTSALGIDVSQVSTGNYINKGVSIQLNSVSPN